MGPSLYVGGLCPGPIAMASAARGKDANFAPYRNLNTRLGFCSDSLLVWPGLISSSIAIANFLRIGERDTGIDHDYPDFRTDGRLENDLGT